MLNLQSKEELLQNNFESKSEYGESDHPDVDELYNRVSKVDQKCIATVYRTVKLFEEAGILTNMILKVKARYEATSKAIMII